MGFPIPGATGFPLGAMGSHAAWAHLWGLGPRPMAPRRGELHALGPIERLVLSDPGPNGTPSGRYGRERLPGEVMFYPLLFPM